MSSKGDSNSCQKLSSCALHLRPTSFVNVSIQPEVDEPEILYSICSQSGLFELDSQIWLARSTSL